ncbi:MAG: RluA family pseudouridine synthase [Deltaproteobacteria bacterium]|nr:MAG: RluA family pseudouridine synthase [Deltaproteobacteria bacterium]
MTPQVRVAPPAPPERLDRVVAALFSEQLPSRAAAKSACKRGEVWVDGAPAEPSRLVSGGEEIALQPRSGPLPAIWDEPLEVVYEDDAIAVVVKPPGVLVSGNQHQTLVHALPANLKPSARPDALPRPQPAHRLDLATSGLVAVGKTASALAALNAAFAERRVHKRYRAVVNGRLEGAGTLSEPLDGRPCETRYAAVEHGPSVRCGWTTVVDLWPLTGRTHQLRRHLAGIGHAIAGDRLYGERRTTLRGQGLFLAAVELTLPHPDDGREITVEIPPPAKHAALLRREARRCARLGLS